MYIPLHLFSSLPTAMIPSEHWEINLETPFSCEQTYEIWLQNWSSHLLGSHSSLQIPHSACQIHTPLKLTRWQQALSHHPNEQLAQFFLEGISGGFRIGYNCTYTNLKAARKNLEGARQHPEVVDEYLSKELALNRIVGPYKKSELPSIQISRFGVIPKRHQQNSWRLIIDLSHPKTHSVNDGIPKGLCGLSYITIDDAIHKILQLGRNTLLAKIDIKSAFRLLPVHPADRHLLGMEWRKFIYLDTCLPFGLRSAPKLFNILADLLAWIVSQKGVSICLHYLDDFLTMGPPATATCQSNLATLMSTCEDLGIPLATEKLEGPSTTLTFLGVVIDTAAMEIRLPDDKLQRIHQELVTWMGKKKATKRNILSLVGLLQHATKVVKCGRSFVARMYAAAARVKELDYFTWLNVEFRSDLMWWHLFIDSWNGLCLLRSETWSSPADYYIQTDASGNWGCGAFFDQKWFQWQWPHDGFNVSIMAKELVPIAFSCAVWGPRLAKSKVLVQCDNLSLVTAISRGSSRDKDVMRLLRCMWFFVAYFDIDLHAEHIAGVSNTTADQLSRNYMQSFFSSHPQVSLLPTPLPPALLEIVSSPKLDWISPHFSTLFRDIITWVQHRAPGSHTPQE